jgi:hypothetical protein
MYAYDLSDETYIIDSDTKNKSFLTTYFELVKLGIPEEDCTFFLRLYDEDLQGVDPHSPNLTKLQKTKISREIIINPWYFYREVARVPVSGNKKGIRFKLHRGNLALLFCLHNNISTIIELSRQNFKTISSVCFYHYQFDFATEASTFLFSNKIFGDSKLNIERLRKIRRLSPSWLISKSKEDLDNLEYISNATRGNRSEAVSTANDLERADKLGKHFHCPFQ